jgi:hypothetical protein
MYRIVKRIVQTVTTVTWLVRLEDNSVDGNIVEKEIIFPASVSVTEEDVTDKKNITMNKQKLSKKRAGK